MFFRLGAPPIKLFTAAHRVVSASIKSDVRIRRCNKCGGARSQLFLTSSGQGRLISCCLLALRVRALVYFCLPCFPLPPFCFLPFRLTVQTGVRRSYADAGLCAAVRQATTFAKKCTRHAGAPLTEWQPGALALTKPRTWARSVDTTAKCVRIRWSVVQQCASTTQYILVLVS